MSRASSRFHSRAPRYVLSTGDDRHLRFAPMSSRGRATQAAIRDLSESGLAFSITGTTLENVPEEGEMLKIEFIVPDRGQIACFGTVMRVETLSEWDPEWGDRTSILVGVAFRNLPKAYQRLLGASITPLASRETPGANHVGGEGAHSFALGATAFALTILFYVMALPPRFWLEAIRDLF